MFTMTLQWSMASIFVICEIILILIFFAPWIRSTRWEWFFQTRLIRLWDTIFHVFGFGFGAILLVLFLDSIRQMYIYTSDGNIDLGHASSMMIYMQSPVMCAAFRAERNFCIAGIAIFLWLVLHRMRQLITKEAHLMNVIDLLELPAEGGKHDRVFEHERGEKLKKTIIMLQQDLKKAVDDLDTMRGIEKESEEHLKQG